ncbi:MAG: PIN domain-containing protein [Rhodobacteraceae bacterium]|nr:PIN domain-containing protein [Paracoccaceae bacterium]MCY3941653.1 PIN domain-containing protein [Gammaproteobacteria bacterium]
MRVVDTNVLLYAADKDSEFHVPCRRLLESLRADPVPSYLSWSICYEFLRVSTHPRVFRSPWNLNFAWSFISSILAAPGFALLTETNRHQAVLGQTMAELPGLRGNILHDVHTAVIMRENGINRIYTRDTDFARFPFLTIIDPLT